MLLVRGGKARLLGRVDIRQHDLTSAIRVQIVNSLALEPSECVLLVVSASVAAIQRGRRDGRLDLLDDALATDHSTVLGVLHVDQRDVIVILVLGARDLLLIVVENGRRANVGTCFTLFK